MSELPLSNQESAMPEEQSISHSAVTGDTAAPAQEPAYEPITEEDDYAPLAEGNEDQEEEEEDDDDWLEEPEGLDELPPRPRRRLLGAGANPIPVALIGVLLTAGGFIGGVLVEKGQTSSSGSPAAAGLASRFAALRGGGAGAGGSTATSSGASTTGGGASGSGASGGGAGGFAGGRFGGLGGAGGATIGEVSFIAGNTLYVTSAEGNTVKITTSPASSITKTVKTDVHGIHPGETVIVRGAKGSSGAISAESVSVSAAGATGGGLASLFGGGSSSASGSSGTTRGGAGASGGGEPALFGK
jgi:hypothetical protein